MTMPIETCVCCGCEVKDCGHCPGEGCGCYDGLDAEPSADDLAAEAEQDDYEDETDGRSESVKAELSAWTAAENALRDALALVKQVRMEVEANRPSLSIGGRMSRSFDASRRAANLVRDAHNTSLDNA